MIKPRNIPDPAIAGNNGAKIAEIAEKIFVITLPLFTLLVSTCP